MTPAQLEDIRQSAARTPTAFDLRGRFIIPKSLIFVLGPLAIGHRFDLLRYVDELRQKVTDLGGTP